MNAPENWKLEKIMDGCCDSLKNARLTYVPRYHRFSKKWEHEHCTVCLAVIGEEPEDLHAAYRNDVEPSRMDWLCEDCYAEFKDLLHVTLDTHPALKSCKFSKQNIEETPIPAGGKPFCELCTAAIQKGEDYLQTYLCGQDGDGGIHILCERCYAEQALES